MILNKVFSVFLSQTIIKLIVTTNQIEVLYNSSLIVGWRGELKFSHLLWGGGGGGVNRKNSASLSVVECN